MILNKVQTTPEEMLTLIQQYYHDGYRMVTATCIDEGQDFRIIYSFDRELTMVNLEITTPREKALPGITAIYACAFLIENEMKELYGLKINHIAVDLGGRMYMAEGVKPSPMAKEIKPAAKGDLANE